MTFNDHTMIIHVLKTGGTLAVSEPFIQQCEYNNSRLMQGTQGALQTQNCIVTLSQRLIE